MNHSYKVFSIIRSSVKPQPALLTLIAIAVFLLAGSPPAAGGKLILPPVSIGDPVNVSSQGQTDPEVALLDDPHVECSSYDAGRRVGFGILKDGFHFSFNSWDRDGNHGFKCVLMISCIQDESWLSRADDSEASAQKKVLQKLKPLIARIVKDKKTVSKITADLKPEKIEKGNDDPLGWFVHTSSDRYNSIDVKVNYQEFFFTVTVYCSGS